MDALIKQSTGSLRHLLVPFFWLMLGTASSITAVHVELVFMSVKPSSIMSVKQSPGTR